MFSYERHHINPAEGGHPNTQVQHSAAVAVQSAVSANYSALETSPDAGSIAPRMDTALTSGAVFSGLRTMNPSSNRAGCDSHQNPAAGLCIPPLALHNPQVKRRTTFDESNNIHLLKLMETVPRPPPIIFTAPPPAVDDLPTLQPLQDAESDSRVLTDLRTGQGGPSTGDLSPTPHGRRTQKTGRKNKVQHIERIADGNREDGHDAEFEKRYACPVEGCSKSYKQANGLKYHLK